MLLGLKIPSHAPDDFMTFPTLATALHLYQPTFLELIENNVNKPPVCLRSFLRVSRIRLHTRLLGALNHKVSVAVGSVVEQLNFTDLPYPPAYTLLGGGARNLNMAIKNKVLPVNP